MQPACRALGANRRGRQGERDRRRRQFSGKGFPDRVISGARFSPKTPPRKRTPKVAIRRGGCTRREAGVRSTEQKQPRLRRPLRSLPSHAPLLLALESAGLPAVCKGVPNSGRINPDRPPLPHTSLLNSSVYLASRVNFSPPYIVRQGGRRV